MLSFALIKKMIVFQSKFGNNQARIEGFSCRKSLFLQNEALLAETASFGSFGISAEINFFEEPSFGFRQNDKNSLSVDHYKRVRRSRLRPWAG